MVKIHWEVLWTLNWYTLAVSVNRWKRRPGLQIRAFNSALWSKANWTARSFSHVWSVCTENLVTPSQRSQGNMVSVLPYTIFNSHENMVLCIRLPIHWLSQLSTFLVIFGFDFWRETFRIFNVDHSLYIKNIQFLQNGWHSEYSVGLLQPPFNLSWRQPTR